MNFRLKLALSMICLMSLIFSIGAAALMYAGFDASVQREKEIAQESALLLASALRSVSEIEGWTEPEDAIATLSAVTAQEKGSAVQLASPEGELFARNPRQLRFWDYRDKTSADQMSVGVFTDEKERFCVQVTACLNLGETELYLTLVRDATGIQESYRTQLRLFRQIFGALALVCAAASFALSAYLTRPLNRLSRSAREIASGNFAARSRIAGHDEIADLSRDFDRMAQRVEGSVEELRDAVKRQEQFMGSFTHELKTPMTSIIGYADLLRSDVLSPEEVREAADTIFREGRRLENLSMLLMDIFVADKRDIRMRLVYPADLVESVVRQLRPSYAEQGIEIQYETVRGYCRLEPDLVRTLLINLMDNARKAMPEGGRITVRTRKLEDGIELTVEDTGKGIPKEAIPHLLEAFYRVDKHQARAQGGAGLGLALCAKIVELHHGDIRFDSVPGQGTQVTVQLRGGAV